MAGILRISHPAFSGSKRDETMDFYTRLLRMEIVLQQPNLDFPSEDHVFFHVGADNFIAYFLPRNPEDAASYEQARPGSGWMDHLAMDVSGEGFDAALQRLEEAGVEVHGPVDRGYERSIYFKDPNGITLELLVWITPPPAGLPQAAIIKRAQAIREARGAEFIEDRDIRAAIAEFSQGSGSGGADRT
jgi:catechol 2,3-dioxygenase-like lactoylglutathione lyase family enzyme